jgi:hypothetical protein
MKWLKSLPVAIAYFLCINAIAQQPNSEAERMLQALKQSGLVRQEGNHIIFKVKKASDTAQMRLLYGTMFASDKWTMGFEVEGNPNTKPVTKPVTNEVNNRVTTNTTPVNQPINRNNHSCSCFSNMQVFNYETNFGNKANPSFTEHSFTVPEGVTKIKIEAWSAGGDGWSEMVDIDERPNDDYYFLRGGGGGGGAYLLTVLTVKAGDVLNMRVPAGGNNGALTLQLNDRSTDGINLLCGRNAKETTPSINRFDGKGGKLGLRSGVFMNNVLVIEGADGEPSYIGFNYDNRTELRGEPGNPFNVPVPDSDKFDAFLGNGGNTPGGGTGGMGLRFTRREIAAKNHIEATDGKLPGGGGGAGYKRIDDGSVLEEFKNGKGAPGLIIIYY